MECDADFEHFAVKHSAGAYVCGMAGTNGIESFWSMLKRGYVGTYQKTSRTHVGRYVTESSGRHNDRDSDTLDQMRFMARNTKARNSNTQTLRQAHSGRTKLP